MTTPCRYWPGSSSVGTGERLSTVIVRTAEVVLLPAMSVTTTWIVAEPSGPPAEFHVVVYGAVVSVSIDEPRTTNPTDAIGEVTSAADAVIPTLPETTAPSVGAPTSATFGAVLSTTLSGSVVVVVLFALSVTRIWRS